MVVLFPMTRSKDNNHHLWEALINTVNKSQVSHLVLIDKTLNFEGAEFFIKRKAEILPRLVIYKRPRREPTHDSQSLITLGENMWILQLHDDDYWEGEIAIPEPLNSNLIYRTNFSIGTKKEYEMINDNSHPTCRTIFSLLPSSVWNTFVQMIREQGGHVAGSIDSSLNIALRHFSTAFINDFHYFYDNRHWSNRKLSKANLLRLTALDGWGRHATIEVSLVARILDGISGIIFFNREKDIGLVQSLIQEWIEETKPNPLRVIYFHAKHLLLCCFRENNKAIFFRNSQQFIAILEDKIRIEFILACWRAKRLEDMLQSIECAKKLSASEFLTSRILFWEREIKLHLSRND